MSNLVLRRAREEDIPQLNKVFKESILSIKEQDYTRKQLEVWSSRSDAPAWWKDKLNLQYFLLAFEADELMGFGSIYHSGFLDLLYVDKAHQNKGIARKILVALEDRIKTFGVASIQTEASITAKPFFEKMGFSLVKENQIDIEGVTLANYTMVKNLS